MPPDFTGLVLEGKYRLTVALGAGAMGHVWRAEHVRLGRPFAVKLLRPELVSDPTVLARFQQEAQAAARIGNRHIVDIVDVGQTPGGAPFLVMEFLRGRSLAAELAAHGPLPVVRAIDLTSQILDGLAAAHAAGIVHRDLKPDNVFVLPEAGGRDYVKLLDFGIAKAKADPKAQHLTRTGMLLGTPRYMSPEQVLGRRDVDRRADVWAAGVILYECLTGRVPFEAPDLASTLTAILQQTPVTPATWRPELEPWLGGVVLRALAKEPNRRFDDAAAFRAALQGAEPSWDAPSPLGGRTPSWSTASGPTPSWAPVPASPTPGSFGGAGVPGPSGGPGAPATLATAGSPGAPAASTLVPQVLLATAPSLAPQRPPVWPWMLAGLLVLGVAVAAVWFVVARALDDSAGSAAVDGGTFREAPGPGSEVTADGQAVLPSTRLEELSLDEQRERWVGLQADISCEVGRESLRSGKVPGSDEVARRWEGICARYGLEPDACRVLSLRFVGDPQAQNELLRRTRVCAQEMHGLPDAGGAPADARGGSPDASTPAADVGSSLTPDEAVSLMVTVSCRSLLAAPAGPGSVDGACIRAEALRLVEERGATELEFARAYEAAQRSDPELTEKIRRRAEECVQAVQSGAAAVPE